MAKKQLLSLTTDSTYDGDLFMVIQKAGMSEAKKMLISVPVTKEATDRETADAAIRAGAGLHTDGTFVPVETTSYLKTADFTNAGLSKTIKNAITMLDAAIASTNEIITETIVIEATAPRRLNSEPVAVIECPEGSLINVIECLAYIDYSGGALACGEGVTLDLNYSGGETIGSFTAAFLASEADVYQKMLFEANLAPCPGEDVELYTSADDTNLTSTSDIYLIITYQIHESL